jgi:hypothetical protein
MPVECGHLCTLGERQRRILSQWLSWVLQRDAEGRGRKRQYNKQETKGHAQGTKVDLQVPATRIAPWVQPFHLLTQ